jgi:hypothetical protein
MSEDDMVIAIDDLNTQIQAGNWGKGRATGTGGVSGASFVIQAIMEVTGRTLDQVKKYFADKLAAEAVKPEGERISRRDMYNAFRVAGTKTGEIIKRLEEAKLAKTAKLSADDELANI